MKTIGEAIKEARIRKKFSVAKLAKETKIKRGFIEGIEKGDWESLPEFPVVSGFVGSIAGALKIDKRELTARLRRDYPPKKLRINPKPDVSDKFVWGPRLTFITGVGVVLLLVFSYLFFQYTKFISPPPLKVEKPQEGEVVRKPTLEVLGTTGPEAVIRVNNQPVLVEEDGSFAAEIEIFEGTKEIEIKAVSRSGKETVVRRKIVPELSK
ncbi:helix-turn-helix domain-containing protein [Patescibacteria group bacterium]|nr:helix-turn-helix domain-containing protein [Patescibacteria group bacterium]